MALTLAQLWQQQSDIYAAEQTAAHADLVLAQAALDPTVVNSPANRLAADQAALNKTIGDIAAARAKLAVTTIPAEAKALIDKITNLIVTQRGLQGSVLDDRDDVAEAQANADAATAVQSRVAARLARASANLAQATADDSRRTVLKNAAAAAPFATLKNDATTFLASTTVTNAKSRLGKNFPPEIVAIAQKRRDSRVNRLTKLQTALQNAQDALATDLAADTGLVGVTAKKQVSFVRAETVLRNYLATAKSRYDKAVVTMKALEAIELAPGTTTDILTDAEKAELAAEKTAGAAAEPGAEAIDAALDAVYAADSDLDAQILTQIAAGVDQLAADPTVKAKRDAVTAKAAALQTAKDAFKAAASPNKADLDHWEAVIPDAAWQVLLDFEQGMAALNELSGIDPTTFGALLDSAENDYAVALAAAELAQRRVDYLGDAITLRQKRLDKATDAFAARLPSAIRGDSF
jgi:hypothetical protein